MATLTLNNISAKLSQHFTLSERPGRDGWWEADAGKEGGRKEKIRNKRKDAPSLLQEDNM